MKLTTDSFRFGGMEWRLTPMDEITGIPKTVYKYRRWNDMWHKRIITNNEIYFSPPDQLGDEYECRLPYDFGKISDAEWEAFQYRIISSQCPEMTPSEIIQKIKHEIGSHKDIRFNVEWQKEWIENVYKERDLFLGVFCTTTSPANYQLWSHSLFGFRHKGFCVGFNTEVLVKNHEKFGAGARVKYFPEDEVPSIKPIRDENRNSLDKYLEEIYNLRGAYAYQQEYRFTKSYQEVYDGITGRGPKVPDSKQKELRTVTLPPEAYKEIIFGDRLSGPKREAIYEIVHSKMTHVEFLVAVRDKENETISLEPYNS